MQSRLRCALCAALLGLWAFCLPAMPSDSPTPQVVQAELLTTLKAKKAKVGDIVSARTMAPLVLPKGVVIPVGTKLLGQVKQVEAESTDAHPALIAVSFDQAELEKSKISLKLSLRAAMIATAKPQEHLDHKVVSPSEGGVSDHVLNGKGYSVMEIGMNPAAGTDKGHQAMQAEPPKEEPKVTAAHTGTVIGIPGVILEVVDGPDRISTFKSSGKSLQLDQGLWLMFSVEE